MNNIAGSLNSITIQHGDFSNNAAVPYAGSSQSIADNNNLAKVNFEAADTVSASANGMQNTGSVKSAAKNGAAPVADVNKNLQAVLKAEVKKSLNPVPALSTLTLFKWDPKAGGTVIDIVNSKTGKVESQIPSEEFIKYMMSHYQKGALLNEKI